MKPIAITGQLVDVRNIAAHKSARLLIDVPAEQAASIIAAFGWPTMVSPVPVAVARLTNPVMDQSELAGQKQLESASPPLASCAPNSGFDSRDGGQPEAPKARRHWDDLSPAQQCGIRCADPIFRKFLEENYGQEFNNEDSAAMFMRDYFRIESRSDLTAKHWSAFDKTFQAWKVADRVGA